MLNPLTPCLTIDGASQAIEFYKRAFDAVEVHRTTTEDGKHIMMAQLTINGGTILVWDQFEQAQTGKQAPFGVTIHIEIADADGLWRQAVDAGATITMPLEDQFWGARYGQLDDPYGHHWSIGTPSKRD